MYYLVDDKHLNTQSVYGDKGPNQPWPKMQPDLSLEQRQQMILDKDVFKYYKFFIPLHQNLLYMTLPEKLKFALTGVASPATRPDPSAATAYSEKMTKDDMIKELKRLGVLQPEINKHKGRKDTLLKFLIDVAAKVNASSSHPSFSALSRKAAG